MLKTLQKIEERVSNIEAKILIIVVIVMLLLAVYNVLYRNVLVPIQSSSNEAHEKEVREKAPLQKPTKEKEMVKPKTKDDEGFGGSFGDEPEEKNDEGFGGSFGEEPEEKTDEGFGGSFGEEPEEKTDEGFGGGFGEEPEEKTDEGFGGGFGDEPEEKTDEGFGGGFGEKKKKRKKKTQISRSNIPFTPTKKTALSNFIDAIKLDWIDILLRHLVLVVGFLGAMLATTRRKHITVDALSKALPPSLNAKLGVLTNLLSMGVCILLANAGADLVSLGLEYPKEIMSWANESTMQLVFPIGFGLLALHFGIRVLENIDAVKTGDFSILGETELPLLSGDEPPGEARQQSKEEEE